MQDNILEYFGINVDKLRESVDKSAKIEDAEEFFVQMTSVVAAKKMLKDAIEQIEAVESDAKGLINAKAKALYGADWQVISGDTFKITRSRTGDLYTIHGDPSAKFIKIKKTVDSKAVEEFITKNDRLPKGIELNDKRGESLRITLK